jgi:hypothetical protein
MTNDKTAKGSKPNKEKIRTSKAVSRSFSIHPPLLRFPRGETPLDRGINHIER